MAPRNGPKKSTALSIEASHALTNRTALLIERVEKTLAKALTSLHKERYELKEFAYKHFGHISPEQAPTEKTPQAIATPKKRKI